MKRYFTPLIISILTISTPHQSCAQETPAEFPVYQRGKILLNPWAGGINTVQVSEWDVNADGLQDLVLFDRTGSRFLTFLREGEHYIFAPEWLKSLPDNVVNLALFRDFDCDNDADLFTQNNGGLTIWEQTRDAENKPDFKVVIPDLQSFLEFENTSFFSNLFVNQADVPFIGDIDNDGDLDILTFDFTGDRIDFHLNEAMEKSGECGMQMAMQTRCYAYIRESFSDGSIALGTDSCPGNVFPKSAKAKHSGSSVARITVDDTTWLFLGEINRPNLNALHLVTDAMGYDSAISVIPKFPPELPLATPTLAATYPIFNLPGRDTALLVSPTDITSPDTGNQLWYYRRKNRTWELVTRSFLQEDMLDFGHDAVPVPVDLDKDGLTDLVLSAEAADSNGITNHVLSWLRNIGSTDEPVFERIDPTDCPVTGAWSRRRMIPVFGNFDADADLEMIVATRDSLFLFNPLGESPCQYVCEGPLILQDAPAGNREWHPAAIDRNGDGRHELILGKRDGSFDYIVPGPHGLQWQWQQQNLGNINVSGGSGSLGNATAASFNAGGKHYLLAGGNRKHLTLYQWPLLADDAFQPVDSLFADHGSWGHQLAPAVADWDNDGQLDLVMGLKTGGLVAFRSVFTSVTSSDRTARPLLLPNPGSGHFDLYCNPAIFKQLRISDISGRRILEQQIPGDTRIRIETAPWSSGMYIIQLSGSGNTTTLKWIKTSFTY